MLLFCQNGLLGQRMAGEGIKLFPTQGAMIKQLVITAYFAEKIIIRLLRVQKIGKPQHTKITLYRRGKAQPVVRAKGNLIIMPGLDRRQLLPCSIIGSGIVNAVGRKQDHIGVPKQDLLHIHFVSGALAGRLIHNGGIAAHHIDQF